MTDTADAASIHVEGEGARLSVTIAATAADALQLRYRLRNTGAGALAVFDRGNRHAVLGGRQAAGAAGAPTFEETADGTVIRHAALPAPATPTGPTLPATPLARRLGSGDLLEEDISLRIPGSTPQRVRWCLGIAPFADDGSFRPDASHQDLWQADDAAVARQRLLCTPWFELATGRFASA